MKETSESYDVSPEAQAEGISLPVVIDGPLMETLTPSRYLESLGITRGQRVANLLRLTRAVMNPLEEKGLAGETRIPLPFMVLRGPLVREDCLTVTISVSQNRDGEKAITITQVMESDT